MKIAYPKEGWEVHKKENNNKQFSFNITSCLYCEELKKRNAIALCRAFCQTDHAAYDSFSPAVVFKRKDTLAKNGKKMWFLF